MIYHILLKPDAIWRGCLTKLINSLVYKYKVEVVAWCVINPSEDLINIMHISDFKWEFDYYLFNKELFRLGPSISLMIRTEMEEKELLSIKGDTLPYKCKKNSIRGEFSVWDRNINLIHMADSKTKSELELIEIYGCLDIEDVETKDKVNVHFINEIENQILYENNFSLSDVIDKIYLRMKHRIYLLQLNTSKPSFYTNRQIENIKIMHSILLKFDKDRTLLNDSKFLEFLFCICDNNMIYISTLERYILRSNSFYYNVNRHS